MTINWQGCLIGCLLSVFLTVVGSVLNFPEFLIGMFCAAAVFNGLFALFLVGLEQFKQAN